MDPFLLVARYNREQGAGGLAPGLIFVALLWRMVSLWLAQQGLESGHMLAVPWCQVPTYQPQPWQTPYPKHSSKRSPHTPQLWRRAGMVSLCAGEAFLPVQSCIRLLGPRLKAVAVAGILRMAMAGMERREEWQVRKAATDTMALLANSLLQHRQQQRGASKEASGLAPDSGLGALVQALPQLLTAVEQHVKYDRVSQVRQAAAALVQVGVHGGCVYVEGKEGDCKSVGRSRSEAELIMGENELAGFAYRHKLVINIEMPSCPADSC